MKSPFTDEEVRDLVGQAGIMVDEARVAIRAVARRHPEPSQRARLRRSIDLAGYAEPLAAAGIACTDDVHAQILGNAAGLAGMAADLRRTLLAVDRRLKSGTAGLDNRTRDRYEGDVLLLRARLDQTKHLVGVVNSEEKVRHMVALGGTLWMKHGKARIYFNDWSRFAGLDDERRLDGYTISRSSAAALLGLIDKVWYDMDDGKIYIRAFDPGTARAHTVRWHGGAREVIDVPARIRAGIKAALAAQHHDPLGGAN